MKGSALFSPCKRYRYRLSRTWGDMPPLGFVMLNPSTADADVLDPTVRRCVGFAKRQNAGGVMVCNLSPYRATNPRDLLGVDLGVSHDEQAAALVDLFSRCLLVVVAWGAGVDTYFSEDDRLAAPLLVAAAHKAAGGGFPIARLGPPTAAGHPRHPLYLRSDTPLVTHEIGGLRLAA